MGEKEGEEERRRTRDCKEKNLPVRIQYRTINKNRIKIQDNQKRFKIIKQHTGVHKGEIFTPANTI